MADKRTFEKAGRRAEVYAAWLLRLKGYRILARRFKTKRGEIDLIAQRGQTLAIIEVKRRKTLVSAQESLTYQTRQRIMQAAEIYVSRTPAVQDLALRFDAVFVMGLWRIRHEADVWRNY